MMPPWRRWGALLLAFLALWPLGLLLFLTGATVADTVSRGSSFPLGVASAFVAYAGAALLAMVALVRLARSRPRSDAALGLSASLALMVALMWAATTRPLIVENDGGISVGVAIVIALPVGLLALATLAAWKA